jgi:lipopolysaccharide transport system ATP-binding protein
MSDLAICVENLGKRYRIGAREKRVNTLRERLSNLAASPFDYFLSVLRGPSEEEIIWALKDVSFEVKHGEVLGIIGRNGAGKSTLLKILSRITEPTTGRAEVYGRVASLLEVGTGFHIELTGRENVYMNGAILGMSRAEIDRKFDEIVDFSGVEKFIDTPVKRYSSGMYVRLAFAVAAYLEPEILLVDEVLAVGDVEFQKKCLGKMQDVTQREGRTVLFVSHNMAAIKSLCNHAMLLDVGHIVCNGDVNQVVDTYLMAGTEMSQTGIIPDNAPRIGTGEVHVRQVELLNSVGDPVSQLYLGQSFRIVLTLEVAKDIQDAVIEVGISTLDGIRVTSSFTVDGEQPPIMLPKGWHRVCLDLALLLLPRYYMLDVGVHHLSGLTADFVERTLEFAVLNVAENNADRYHWSPVRGFIRPVGRWQPPEPTEALST